MVQRGDVCWADFGEPTGSEPGYRHPLVVVSDDSFNRSRIATAVGVVVTSNLRLLDAPGNVSLPAAQSGLPHDSVANVSQVITIDKAELSDPVGALSPATMEHIDNGLVLALGLSTPLRP